MADQRDGGIGTAEALVLRAKVIVAAKEWAEWRTAYGGLQVHASEDRLFDAVLALERSETSPIAPDAPTKREEGA